MALPATLTPDTQTVLLLCGELGQRTGNGLKPLGLRQYNTLAFWLKDQGLRPGDLLSAAGQARLEQLRTAEISADRVTPLLQRGTALALMVEKWERSGLWVMSRSDADYPDRLKRYLGSSAPALLYGVGKKDLLNRGGLAIVGSRDRSDEDAEFARRAGEACARQNIAVISGAAKGIDRDAMSGALEAGGTAVGVLAEGLAKTATSGQYRSGLMSEELCLISPFDPDARWFAWTAMERNKLLYGLSDAALVVCSAAENGGTWAGATEALQLGKVRVYVKVIGTLAPGNRELLKRGAVALPEEPWEDIRSLLLPPANPSPSLFAQPTSDEAPVSPAHSAPQELEAALVTPETPTPDASAADAPPADDAYTLVIDTVLSTLTEARTEEWLAEKLSVRTAQMKDWLERAVQEGRIQKLKKPTRYAAVRAPLFAA